MELSRIETNNWTSVEMNQPSVSNPVFNQIDPSHQILVTEWQIAGFGLGSQYFRFISIYDADHFKCMLWWNALKQFHAINIRDLRIGRLRSNWISNRIGRYDSISNWIFESNFFNSNEY